MTDTPPGGHRRLNAGETALARGMFGDAIRLDAVELRRRRWAFFQPRHVVMAPRGHLHFHPAGSGWREDFAAASLADQGLFVHELVLFLRSGTSGGELLECGKNLLVSGQFRRAEDGVTSAHQKGMAHYLRLLLDAVAPQGPARNEAVVVTAEWMASEG